MHGEVGRSDPWKLKVSKNGCTTTIATQSKNIVNSNKILYFIIICSSVIVSVFIRYEAGNTKFHWFIQLNSMLSICTNR